MAAPKHTPGPWRTDPACGDEQVLAARGELVADCCIMGGLHRPNGERIRANARLIAAAPQLAGALLAASRALRSYQYGNAAPDLAKEIADAADGLLAQAGWGEAS